MKYYFLILSSLFLISSCSNNHSDIVSPVGMITTYVSLNDEFGNKQSSSEGVKVTLNNINPKTTGISDKNGRCELLNVNRGKYDIVVSKPGYGDYWVFQLNHDKANTVLDEIALYQQSTTKVTDLKISYNNSTSKYEVTGNYTPATEDRWLRFFVGTSTVSSTNYLYSPQDIFSVSGGTFKFTISKEEIITTGAPSGTKFHVIAYGSPGKSSSYFDPNLKMNLFPALSSTPSNIAEGTVE